LAAGVAAWLFVVRSQGSRSPFAIRRRHILRSSNSHNARGVSGEGDTDPRRTILPLAVLDPSASSPSSRSPPLLPLAPAPAAGGGFRFGQKPLPAFQFFSCFRFQPLPGWRSSGAWRPSAIVVGWLARGPHYTSPPFQGLGLSPRRAPNLLLTNSLKPNIKRNMGRIEISPKKQPTTP
jgi:hypothetical protein